MTDADVRFQGSRWVPAKRDTMSALAAEIRQHYARGGATIAVDDPAGSPFAEELAEALREAGSVVSVTSDVAARPALGELLLVSGSRLLVEELRGRWNFSIRLEGIPHATDDERRYIATVRPRGLATAIVDVADPEHPRRVFADSC